MAVRVSQGATLKSEVYIELEQYLFPGVRVPIVASGTVHRASRLMKLKTLKVEESSDGFAASVTLTPASEADLGAEE